MKRSANVPSLLPTPAAADPHTKGNTGAPWSAAPELPTDWEYELRPSEDTTERESGTRWRVITAAVQPAGDMEAPPPPLEHPLLRELTPARRKRAIKARTLDLRRIPKQEDLYNDALFDLEARDHAGDRPHTRADCVGGPRPCPWVSCRYHLYLDVSPRTGSLKLNFPDLEVWEMEECCALDVADRGRAGTEQIGTLLNLTRERARQLEEEALLRARSKIEG